MKTKIAVLIPEGDVRASFVPPPVMDELAKLGEVVYNDAGYEPSVMAQLLSDADICVTGWGCPTLDNNVISGASRLKLVAHTGGSVAPIVSNDLYERGIIIVSGNELFADSVAEGALAYMLAGLRRIPYYNTMVQKGEWRSAGHRNNGLLDKKVGIVGFGAVSRNLVPLLKSLRVEIMIHCDYLSDEDCHRYGMTRAGSLEQIFSTCDIVSLHLARTPETYHIINKDLLALMPDGALLVNTARGSLIDEHALEDELLTGRIHAVLDVYEEEPLPKNSRLRGLDNVILIPHMAGPTDDRRKRITLALIEDMKRLLNGEPLKYVIDKDYAARMTNDTLTMKSGK